METGIHPGREPAATRPGLYLEHKPRGPTSFSRVSAFVEEVRASGMRPGKLPVCHAGALDPFAEGLLLLLAGPATRLMDFLHPIPKVYLAEIVWGAETDSGDLLGNVTFAGDPSALTAASLDEALAGKVGWQEQVPPAHSNKRVDGERAYRKAHRGEVVVLPPSRVYLHEARFRAHRRPDGGTGMDARPGIRSSSLELVCGGGYYVRALARDLGRALGCGAHLAALRRTSIGPWNDPQPGKRELITGEALLPWARVRGVDAREADRLAARGTIPLGILEPPSWDVPAGFPDPQSPIRAICDGKLVALLRERDSALQPAILLGAGL